MGSSMPTNIHRVSVFSDSLDDDGPIATYYTLDDPVPALTKVMRAEPSPRSTWTIYGDGQYGCLQVEAVPHEDQALLSLFTMHLYVRRDVREFEEA
jgi:hypothetical protein